MNQFSEDRILGFDDNVFIYRLSCVSKDIKRMNLFLNKQSDDHIDQWGSRYSLKECSKKLEKCDNSDIMLCAVVERLNSVCNVVGLVGYNYNKLFAFPDKNECYLSHVIIDEKSLRKRLATRAMKLFLQHIKSNKTDTVKKLYAEIYDDNLKSIVLHKQLGFEVVKSYNGITVLEHSLN